ncbi:MAG: S41 family peptidase [Bacteroidota bacterium]
MKRMILLGLFYGILLSTSVADNQTTFNTSEMAGSISKVDRLYYTCKVWGFLKYYHPKVGSGAYDWDDKLLKVLANTKNITTEEKFNEYLSRWIYAFGPRKPCSACRKPPKEEMFLKNFDLSWTRKRPFSAELQKTFQDIENNRFQGNHHYIEKGNVGQFEPKNESSYFDLNWEDENMRLLPLFRYWNYIEYFFPYKYQTDQPWDEVLKEMIPKFLGASSKLDFHKAILELVVKVDDGHAGILSNTLDQWPYQNYLPAKFEMIEGMAVITEIIDKGKAASDDLRVGDAITAVNGRSVMSLDAEHAKYVWGSNESAKQGRLFHSLFMGLDGTATVEIDRAGTKSSRVLNLYHYSDITYEKAPPAEKFVWLHDSIAYLNLKNLEIKEVSELMEEAMESHVLIIDVRNYPKGTYRAIANFLKPELTEFATFTRPYFEYPGKFRWSGSSKCGKRNEDYYRGKVILLFNQKTQSHAEFTCMCFESAPNVVKVGSQTAGADGNVTRFPLIQKMGTAFSGIGVFYPDRTETQRIGVVPDVVVKPTLAGIRDGRDEVLEEAVAIAKSELQRLKTLVPQGIQLIDSLGTDSLQVDSLNAIPEKFR